MSASLFFVNLLGDPMKSQNENTLHDAEMTMRFCECVEQVPRYVACLVDGDDAERFEAHLGECEYCRNALVDAVESGQGPEWLAICRQASDSTLCNRSAKSSQLDDTLVHSSIADRNGPTTIGDINMSGNLAAVAGERYRFEKQIGEGGMGVVWEGTDTVMRRRVALKRLKSSGNLKVLAPRLLQEAASLARLSHPNIVAVFEVFHEATRPTLVMEYVNGPTLAQWRNGKVIHERHAAMLVEQLALAVQHAHDNGVVHRDLKPSNILLSRQKEGEAATMELDGFLPKLSDFGLARIIDQQHLTQTGEMLGTPAYMAPEQTLGVVSMIGPAADIYGLGAVLYDMLASTPPHVAQDPVSTMALVREREPVAPRLLRPELSKDVETICLKCLRKSSADRYSSAAELAADLRAFLDGRPIKARPLGVFARSIRWGRRHKVLASAIGIAALSIITLVVASLEFARVERSLRRKTDNALVLANQAEAAAIAEAKRADEAKETVQQHFRMTLNVANQLLDVLDTLTLKESVKSTEIAPLISSQSLAIYENYIASLPAPQQWTFREAIEVLRYVELTGPQPEKVVPWLKKFPDILDRIEQENASNPNRHDVRLMYAKCMATLEGGRKNYAESVKWNLQLADLLNRTIDIAPTYVSPIRLQSHVYMNAALELYLSQQIAKAPAVADQSVATYRRVMELTTEPEFDQINFIEKLVWQARVHREAGLDKRYAEIKAEVLRLCDQIPEDSQHRRRADQALLDVQQGLAGVMK